MAIFSCKPQYISCSKLGSKQIFGFFFVIYPVASYLTARRNPQLVSRVVRCCVHCRASTARTPDDNNAAWTKPEWYCKRLTILCPQECWSLVAAATCHCPTVPCATASSLFVPFDIVANRSVPKLCFDYRIPPLRAVSFRLPCPCFAFAKCVYQVCGRVKTRVLPIQYMSKSHYLTRAQFLGEPFEGPFKYRTPDVLQTFDTRCTYSVMKNCPGSFESPLPVFFKC